MRGTLGATLEDLGFWSSLDVEIEYDAWKGEPMIMNPPDKAYPGSDPGAELLSVYVLCWDVAPGDNTRYREPHWLWEVLDQIATAEVERLWDAIYEYYCLEHAAETINQGRD